MSWIELTYGRPGEGKSLDQARTALQLFKSYERTERRYPDLPHRQMWSNQKFSEEIEAKELGEHLFYWENPRQLKDVRHSDILWDEIANHLPADSFKDTPRWLRALFAQHRKRGNRIFANTQDYKAVDINVRRMVGKAYKLRKLIGSRDISVTLPPVKRIWGVCMMSQLDPQGYKEDDKKFVGASIIPTFFLIEKRYCEIFDTSQKILRPIPLKFKHIERSCGRADCSFHKISHV